MVNFEDPGPFLAEDDIAAFEKTLGATLPSQYRTFLSSSNGGVPYPDIVDVEGAPGSPTDVRVFFGIAREVSSSDLYWNRQTFLDRLPERLVPIACDSRGNLFCLSLGPEDAGSVLYVDMQQLKPNVYHVAGDFDAFLAKLTHL